MFGVTVAAWLAAPLLTNTHRHTVSKSVKGFSLQLAFNWGLSGGENGGKKSERKPSMWRWRRKISWERWEEDRWQTMADVIFFLLLFDNNKDRLGLNQDRTRGLNMMKERQTNKKLWSYMNHPAWCQRRKDRQKTWPSPPGTLRQLGSVDHSSELDADRWRSSRELRLKISFASLGRV